MSVACVTTIDLPATVIVPVRSLAEAFLATV